MDFKYRKHYTRDEARALLPEIREWLRQIRELRQHLGQLDQRLASLLSGGRDAGGEQVDQWVKTLCRTKAVLGQFQKREIFIKDIERGLIDFPAIVGGREVFLCWEQDEDDIEFWHDLDTGYAGRERL
jgi:hypothetical protein